MENTKELHENFILLHEFEYGFPPKKWVVDDESYTGSYHNSCDSLMPVVENIYSIKPGDQRGENLQIHLRDCMAGRACPFPTMKESVYNAAVNFIKWYTSDEEEQNDLFHDLENLPQDLRDVIQKYSVDDNTYESCSAMQAECEQLGYTFDYDLEAVPCNLRRLE